MPASIRSEPSAGRPPANRFKDPARPGSPTMSTATSASRLDLGDDGPKVIVTRADLRESVAAYELLLSSAKAYRNALIALSTASTALAGALGECARVKGAGDSGESLLAASGLQYMVANSGQVLSDTLYRGFEVPLMTHYDAYVTEIAARHAEYEELLKEKTARIRETEAENLRRGKKKTRDLDQFRRALHQLTEQVAEVEVCKRTYYSEVLDGESQMWDMIGGKTALLVRSTLDLSDRLASKSTADPVIEAMLREHPDPFDAYRLNREEPDVLAALPPMILGPGTSTPNTSPAKGPTTGLSTVLEAEPSLRDEEDESLASDVPRLQSRTSASVSEILGLREPSEDGPDESNGSTEAAEPAWEGKPPVGAAPKPSQVGSEHASPRKRSDSRASSMLQPSSTSTPDTTADSPALEASFSQSHPEDPPSLTAEAAPFIPSSVASSAS